MSFPAGVMQWGYAMHVEMVGAANTSAIIYGDFASLLMSDG